MFQSTRPFYLFGIDSIERTGLDGLQIGNDRLGHMIPQHWRYGIADKRQVSLRCERKDKLIWERLQSCALPHSQASVKVVMKLDPATSIRADAVCDFIRVVLMVALSAP